MMSAGNGIAEPPIHFPNESPQPRPFLQNSKTMIMDFDDNFGSMNGYNQYTPIRRDNTINDSLQHQVRKVTS